MNIQPPKISVGAMFILFFLISCTTSTFQAGSDIMKGRDALLDSNPKAALPKFEAISQSNPNYIYCIILFCVGI